MHARVVLAIHGDVISPHDVTEPSYKRVRRLPTRFRSESVRTPTDPDHPTLLEAQQFPFYLSDIKPAIDKEMAAIDRPEM